MTIGKFLKLYQAYKDNFDYETTLKNNGIRYADLEKEETLDDAMPF